MSLGVKVTGYYTDCGVNDKGDVILLTETKLYVISLSNDTPSFYINTLPGVTLEIKTPLGLLNSHSIGDYVFELNSNQITYKHALWLPSTNKGDYILVLTYSFEFLVFHRSRDSFQWEVCADNSGKEFRSFYEGNTHLTPAGLVNLFVTGIVNTEDLKCCSDVAAVTDAKPAHKPIREYQCVDLNTIPDEYNLGRRNVRAATATGETRKKVLKKKKKLKREENQEEDDQEEESVDIKQEPLETETTVIKQVARVTSSGNKRLVTYVINKEAENTNDDEIDDENEQENVKCVCGATEEDSSEDEEWVECELCHIWQHTNCVGYYPEVQKYFHCEECLQKEADNEKERKRKLREDSGKPPIKKMGRPRKSETSKNKPNKTPTTPENLNIPKKIGRPRKSDIQNNKLTTPVQDKITPVKKDTKPETPKRNQTIRQKASASNPLTSEQVLTSTHQNSTSTTKETPASSATNETPASSATNETPASSTTKDTPASSTTKDTPASSTTKDTPASSTTKDTPASSTTKETEEELTSDDESSEQSDKSSLSHDLGVCGEGHINCPCGASESESGEEWVCCDGCDKWQHQACVNYFPDENNETKTEQYLCPVCQKITKFFSRTLQNNPVNSYVSGKQKSSVLSDQNSGKMAQKNSAPKNNIQIAQRIVPVASPQSNKLTQNSNITTKNTEKVTQNQTESVQNSKAIINPHSLCLKSNNFKIPKKKTNTSENNSKKNTESGFRVVGRSSCKQNVKQLPPVYIPNFMSSYLVQNGSKYSNSNLKQRTIRYFNERTNCLDFNRSSVQTKSCTQNGTTQDSNRRADSQGSLSSDLEEEMDVELPNNKNNNNNNNNTNNDATRIFGEANSECDKSEKYVFLFCVFSSYMLVLKSPVTKTRSYTNLQIISCIEYPERDILDFTVHTVSPTEYRVALADYLGDVFIWDFVFTVAEDVVLKRTNQVLLEAVEGGMIENIMWIGSDKLLVNRQQTLYLYNVSKTECSLIWILEHEVPFLVGWYYTAPEWVTLCNNTGEETVLNITSRTVIQRDVPEPQHSKMTSLEPEVYSKKYILCSKITPSGLIKIQVAQLHSELSYNGDSLHVHVTPNTTSLTTRNTYTHPQETAYLLRHHGVVISDVTSSDDSRCHGDEICTCLYKRTSFFRTQKCSVYSNEGVERLRDLLADLKLRKAEKICGECNKSTVDNEQSTPVTRQPAITRQQQASCYLCSDTNFSPSSHPLIFSCSNKHQITVDPVTLEPLDLFTAATCSCCGTLNTCNALKCGVCLMELTE